MDKSLKPYLQHLPTCNLKIDWSEAELALSDTPPQFRDYEYDLAAEELNKMRNKCTCGLDLLLKEKEESK